MIPNKIVMSERSKLKQGFKMGTGIGNGNENWELKSKLEFEIGNEN